MEQLQEVVRVFTEETPLKLAEKIIKTPGDILDIIDSKKRCDNFVKDFLNDDSEDSVEQTEKEGA